MKRLDEIDYSICRMQAKLFEASLEKTNVSSPVFIRRFMNSSVSELFDNKTIIYTTISNDDIFDMIDEEFGETNYGKKKYYRDEMYWIGYVYRALSIYYGFTSKVVYKLFPSTEIVKFYNIGHTFDPEDAIERLVEAKKIDFDYTKRGVELLKRYTLLHKLEDLLGTNVKVYIDRPIGYNHNGILYTQNYGYIKEYKALDGEYQDAYVIGLDISVDSLMERW